MRDALFQGYGGAGFTHSSGGGLLEPADFHGMAALLIKDRVKGSKRRQQKALQRLMDPVKGNLLVQLTLTCLEREITSSQPTIPSCSTHPGSESDDDVGDGATLLNPPEFTGAAVSMLPPGDEAEAIMDDVPVIGSTISRSNNKESLHEAETTSANPTVEAFTFGRLCVVSPRSLSRRHTRPHFLDTACPSARNLHHFHPRLYEFWASLDSGCVFTPTRRHHRQKPTFTLKRTVYDA